MIALHGCQPLMLLTTSSRSLQFLNYNPGANGPLQKATSVKPFISIPRRREGLVAAISTMSAPRSAALNAIKSRSRHAISRRCNTFKFEPLLLTIAKHVHLRQGGISP